MTIQNIGSALPTAVVTPSPKPVLPAGGQLAVSAVHASGIATDAAQLELAVQAMRKAIEPMANNLQISIDKDTGTTVVKVVDTSTKEVIRQIPTEEALSIAKSLDKLDGLLFKQEA